MAQISLTSAELAEQTCLIEEQVEAVSSRCVSGGTVWAINFAAY